MHAVPASRSGVFARCLLLFLVGYPQLGCSDAPLTLRVDVRTDYTPIREFESLEVLLGLGSTGAQVQTHTIPVEDSDRFLPAHPVLTTGLDEPGLYRVEVRLRGPDGLPIAEREALVHLRGNTGVTIVLTRNCAEVRCPRSASSDATECRDGICVPADCTPETPESCPPDLCTQDSECTSELVCAEGRCFAGLCFQELDPGRCPDGEVCAPELNMCIPRGAPISDCIPEPEVCDGVDNDCDPTTPDGADEPCPTRQRCTDGRCEPFSVRDMALGWDHTCAALDSGDVYCWGDDSQGQLGSGGNHSISVPRRVEALAGVDIVALTAGRRHTCAKARDGSLYCWGANSLFQLGIPDTEDAFVRTPSRVPISLDGGGVGLGIRATLCAGENFTCVRGTTMSGRGTRVQCWGENMENQLGDPAITPPERSILSFDDEEFDKLRCGRAHACILMRSGAVRCWGDDSEHAVLNTGMEVPVEWPLGDVGLGDGFTCITRHPYSAEALCIGRNDLGQLGLDEASDRRSELQSLPDTAASLRDLASGFSHTCGITARQGIICWGGNTSGQLGVESAGGSSGPVEVPLLERVQQLYAGASQTCVVTAEATATGEKVFCWGANANGQLGTGSTETQRQPMEVVFP